MDDEKNISTESNKKKAITWLPGQDEDQERTEGIVSQAGKGTASAGPRHTIEIGGVRREGFPRTLRLLCKSQFDAVFRQGKRIPQRHLLLFVKPNTLSSPRLGIATGKRYGKAVERNRAKRIVREVFRRFIRQHLPGIDVVVLVRPGRGPLRFDDCLGGMRSGLKEYFEGVEKAQSAVGLAPDSPD